jgi:hypothetical protein
MSRLERRSGIEVPLICEIVCMAEGSAKPNQLNPDIPIERVEVCRSA